VTLGHNDRRFGFSVVGGLEEGFPPRIDEIAPGKNSQKQKKTKMGRLQTVISKYKQTWFVLIGSRIILFFLSIVSFPFPAFVGFRFPSYPHEEPTSSPLFELSGLVELPSFLPLRRRELFRDRFS
jgi:hypothetical protein